MWLTFTVLRAIAPNVPATPTGMVYTVRQLTQIVVVGAWAALTLFRLLWAVSVKVAISS